MTMTGVDKDSIVEWMAGAMVLRQEDAGEEWRAAAGAMDVAGRCAHFSRRNSVQMRVAHFGCARVLSLCTHGQVRKDRQGKYENTRIKEGNKARINGNRPKREGGGGTMDRKQWNGLEYRLCQWVRPTWEGVEEQAVRKTKGDE